MPETGATGATGATCATGATSAVPTPSRLVVLAPNWLGDAVMALPLLADLRRAWPQTDIAIAARRSLVSLFEMVPGIAHTLALDGRGGLQAIGALKRDAAMLAGGGFDAALLLPNSFQAAWLASRARIRERWGFARDLRGRLLTRAIARPQPHVHQAEYYQALALGLGLAVGDRFARVDVTDDQRESARALLREAGVEDGKSFVVFAPGAAYGRAKQWLPERFAELATMLADEHEIATVLIATSADAAVCRAIASSTGSQVRDLAGKTDLSALAGLFSLSDAVVANDSGAMHLAAAVGARIVAVYGPTDDRKTSPLRASPEAPEPRIIATDVWCRPCMLRECPIDHRCMTRVSARAVFEALGRP